MTMQLTLSHAGLDDVSIGVGSDNYGLRTLDLGFPLHREVQQRRPGDHGMIDTTRLEAERVITATVVMPAHTWSQARDLRAFTRPDLRPLLTITQDGAPDMRCEVRALPFGSPVDVGEFAAGLRLVTVQWLVPDGVFESVELHTETIFPGGGDTSDGLEFGATLEFGTTLEFPVVDPPGASDIVNAGDRDARSIIRAFGPFGAEGTASDKTKIGNSTTGEVLTFAGTGIAAGDYLEIDTRAKTIRVNGLASQSRYDRLDFPESKWFTIPPGVSEMIFRPDTFSGNANAVVLWPDAHS